MKLFAINPRSNLDTSSLINKIEQLYPDPKIQKSIVHAMLTTEKWIKNTLGKPHPKLGRRGPVCPYVPRASAESRMYLSYCLYDQQTNVDDICKQMLQFHKIFKKNNDSFLNSIVIPFVSIDKDKEKGPSLVEEAQKILKPNFIESNAMIGQFFPKCPVPGLHSKEFRPFEFNIPCLAIRNLMPQDVVFVSDSKIHSQKYLNRFKVDSHRELLSLLKKNGAGRNRKIISHVDQIFNIRKANEA